MKTEVLLETLTDEMKGLGRLVVAFSGGVDSAVVAAIAHRALKSDALAVTAVSETLSGRELEEACDLAAEIGIAHELMEFSELDDERFKQNTPSRCFFCQSMRFDHLRKIADRVGCEVLAAGTNADDPGDHRPGLKAMSQRKIYQPLLAHGVDKAQVRELAKTLGLSVWDKPAAACLSSRIPHGIPVTGERLARIERAEDHLADLGFRHFRVRAHDLIARVEVSKDELPRALAAHTLNAITQRLLASGFEVVTVDLGGYVSGSLNPNSPA